MGGSPAFAMPLCRDTLDREGQRLRDRECSAQLQKLVEALESSSDSDGGVATQLADRGIALAPDAADGGQLRAWRVQRRPKLSGQAMRIAVYGGAWHKTTGGLRREDMKLKVGSSRVISKRQSLASQQKYRGSKLHAWNTAVTIARERFNEECYNRFVPMGGKTELGQRLLRETRKWYRKLCL